MRLAGVVVPPEHARTLIDLLRRSKGNVRLLGLTWLSEFPSPRRSQPSSRSSAQRVLDTRYWLVLRGLEKGRPEEYKAYLDAQLRRTLVKRTTDPGVGSRLLVRETVQHMSSRRGASVLCIGCRNGFELERFRAHGLEPVGIDLFSQRPDILVMDMHKTLFADDSFDAIYASHSLEHSYDLPAVLAEIARVARDGAVVGIEVPVRHKGSDADLIEFSGLDDVRDALLPIVGHVLHAEEQPAGSDRNGQGSAVARIVFQVQKPASHVVPEPVRAREPRLRAQRKPALVLAVTAVCMFVVFALLPEMMGDWPYNVFGPDHARAHLVQVAPHHTAP